MPTSSARQVLCHQVRTTRPASWAQIETWARAYAPLIDAPSTARADWDALLVALRANPTWDEAAAIAYLARLATHPGSLHAFRQVDRWLGLGHLLIDTPAFAAAIRADGALHAELRTTATQGMALLASVTSGDLSAWTLCALRLLARAGTEPPGVLCAWGETLTRGGQTLAHAQARYGAAEDVSALLPPADAVAADLLGAHAPVPFARRIANLLARRPLVAVLALLQAPAAHHAAIDAADLASALALPGLDARWRTPLLLRASAPRTAAPPAPRRA